MKVMRTVRFEASFVTGESNNAGMRSSKFCLEHWEWWCQTFGAKLKKWCHVSKRDFATTNAYGTEFCAVVLFFLFFMASTSNGRAARASTSGSEVAPLHLRYLRLQVGVIVVRNVVGSGDWFGDCCGYCW
ncbi:hypothetical protein Tco_0446527 [Tanacetum coccineum]